MHYLSFPIDDNVFKLWVEFREETKDNDCNDALRRLIEYYNNIKSEYSLND